MKISASLDSPEIKKSPLVTALGNFDGVHQGHKKLLELLKERSLAAGARASVLTFSPHPLQVIAPSKCPPLLLAREHKMQKFAEAGVDLVIELPFTRETAAMSPDVFVQDIIARGINAKGLIVGYNFNFGSGGKGTARFLKGVQDKYGFFVEVVPPVKLTGTVVSSTVIRRFLQEGRVEKAAEFLGYAPFLEGEVVMGRQVGQTLGFPTANLDVPCQIITPAQGVYAIKAFWEGKMLFGIANIGIRPTFSEHCKAPSVEIHLFNFSENIYGDKLHIEFVRRIRQEKKFSSPEALIDQIAVDVRLTKKFFGLAEENITANSTI